MPLDYYAPRPPDPHDVPREPRLSKLAVASVVLSLGQVCSCPVTYKLGYAIKVAPMTIMTALPIWSFVVSCIALFRILRRMEALRGEGLAITGIIVSFILSLFTAFIATAK